MSQPGHYARSAYWAQRAVLDLPACTKTKGKAVPDFRGDSGSADPVLHHLHARIRLNGRSHSFSA